MRALLPVALLVLGACSDRTIGFRNSGPDAEITSHEDGEQVYQDVPILFRGRVSDPDQPASELVVTWWAGGVEQTACTAVDAEGLTECSMVLTPGAPTITLEVNDGAASDSDQLTLDPVPEPEPNTPPTCSITSPAAMTSFGALDAVEVVGQVDDGQTLPELLAVSFSSDWDGALGTPTPSPSGRVVLSASGLSAHVHEIAMTVTDPEGERCVATVLIEVEDGCGDGRITSPEICDDGVNDGSYDGCMPGCDELAPYCGDGTKQAAFEDCDDGVNDGSYGGCTSTCELGPYCGDGTPQFTNEECDDGVNDGSYDGCDPDCSLGPYCGDGNVDSPDETCDDGVNDSSYNSCTPTCGLPSQYCGDGNIQSAYEDCDDGANNGQWGYCASDCQGPGPYCGDGNIDSPDERCDDGVNNGSYDGCEPGCQQLGPYCGDGTPNGTEDCDDGVNDGTNCNPDCTLPAGETGCSVLGFDSDGSLGDVTTTGAVTLNTATGQITDASGTVVSAGASGFELVSQSSVAGFSAPAIAVWHFDNLTLGGTVTVTGGNAPALLALGDLVITGDVDVSGGNGTSGGTNSKGSPGSAGSGGWGGGDFGSSGCVSNAGRATGPGAGQAAACGGSGG
ncbi:MAG: hypothetical protein EP330_15495, partial [Deltaproteobacteria bacterium]